MQLMRRAALDGVQLDELDPAILIQGVEPGAGRDTIGTASRWDGVGSRVTGRHRDSLDVTVKFSLDIKKNRMEARSFVLERIAAWASAGGWLTLSSKPNRRLRVVAGQLPGEGDPLDWTSRFSLTLRAYGVPYWQDDIPTLGAIATASGNTSLRVPGSMDTPLDVRFTNSGESAVSALDITAGDSVFHLTSLGLLAGETLEIDHPDDGNRSWLRIRICSAAGVYRSALSARTPASSDDLILSPGLRTVTVQATGTGTPAGSWGLTVRGRYA